MNINFRNVCFVYEKKKKTSQIECSIQIEAKNRSENTPRSKKKHILCMRTPRVCRVLEVCFGTVIGRPIVIRKNTKST